MFKSLKFAIVLTCVATSAAVFAQSYSGIGRNATPKEIAAWDIDVRPDFKGLPKGSGTVGKGQQVWDGKCASCHGSFGESNEVFAPIIGGTTKEDMKNGRVAALATGTQPQRTSMMKLPTVSTLWDYINRAMPWTAPKTLTTEEVYAVTAYILNMAEVVPDDFTLSDKNIAEVQKKIPNRNGMTRSHGLGDVRGKPDVKNAACMKNCTPEVKIASSLPDFARNASGNLAQQNRPFGPVRGINTSTSGPAAKTSGPAPVPAQANAASAAEKPAVIAKAGAADGLSLAKQYGCVACHGVSNKIVGPGFTEIAAKYKDGASAETKMIAKVKNGGSGVWGAIPMPAQPQVKDEDIKTMVQWILNGVK